MSVYRAVGISDHVMTLAVVLTQLTWLQLRHFCRIKAGLYFFQSNITEFYFFLWFLFTLNDRKHSTLLKVNESNANQQLMHNLVLLLYSTGNYITSHKNVPLWQLTAVLSVLMVMLNLYFAVSLANHLFFIHAITVCICATRGDSSRQDYCCAVSRDNRRI